MKPLGFLVIRSFFFFIADKFDYSATNTVALTASLKSDFPHLLMDLSTRDTSETRWPSETEVVIKADNMKMVDSTNNIT